MVRKVRQNGIILSMPAILTHDFFGRDVLDAFGQHVEDSTLDERDAFLLGNQGPDPLFFLVIHPGLHAWRKLGGRMHKEHTTELILALSQAIGVLQDHERAIGRAYAQGFLCHYALDSCVHPLVYSRTFAVCDAGIEGLSRSHAREVHAEIEREIDEMVLTKKRNQTVREYPALENTLDASPDVLAVIQKMYAFLALSVYGEQIPDGLFASAVECYRITLSALHSPHGIKRTLIMAAEERLREYSFFGAMAHKVHLVDESWFANSQHESWENPYTGEVRNASFWDLYQDALELVADAIERFEGSSFSEEDARAITREINFSGESNVVLLTIEE